MTRTFRIEMSCPRCGATHETIRPMVPRPHVNCGDCLMNNHEIVEMTIEFAEQIPDEPMINLLMIGPDGEKIED